MTDFARFGVELIDEISSPARRAADALEHIEKKLHDAQGIAALTNREIAALGAARGFEIIGRGASNFAGMLEGAFMGAVHRAADGAWELTRGVMEMATHADQSRRALALLTGEGDVGGDRVFKRSVELAKELGMTIDDTTHSMQKLLAMQFPQAEAEKYVKLGADLRAIGVQGDAVSRVLLDIAHVKATGILNARELMMFANAGVSAQLLMEEVGKAMNVSAAQAYEKMHHRQVTADIALPALERAIMRKTHEHEAGEAGKLFAQNTLAGLTEQLKNMPERMFLRISEIMPKLVPQLKTAVEEITKFIAGIDIEKISKFVGKVIDIGLEALPVAREFFSGFMDGFGEITKSLKSLGIEGTNLKAARDLGREFADMLARVITLAGKAVQLMKELTTNSGLAMVGGLYAGSKALGAATTIGQLMLLFGAGRGGSGGFGGGGIAGGAARVAGKASLDLGESALLKALGSSAAGAVPTVAAYGTSSSAAAAAGTAAGFGEASAAAAAGGSLALTAGAFALAVGIFAAAAYALSNQVKAEDTLKPKEILGDVGARSPTNLTSFQRRVDQEIAEQELAQKSAKEFWDDFRKRNAPTATDTSIEGFMKQPWFGWRSAVPGETAEDTSRAPFRGERPAPQLSAALLDKMDQRPNVDQRIEFNVVVEANKDAKGADDASQLGRDIAESVQREMRKHWSDLAIHGSGGGQ